MDSVEDECDMVDYYRGTDAATGHMAVVQTNDFIAVVSLETGEVYLVKGDE